MSFDLTTFIIQALNFVILVGVLWWLMWKPLRSHMRERARRIEEGLSSVEEGQKEVKGLRLEVESALDEARRTRRESLRDAEIEAEGHKAELLEEARAAAHEERERLLKQLEQMQEARERDLLHGLSPQVAALILSLLSELGEQAHLHERTCARFADHLLSLPAPDRARLVDRARGGRVELTVASQATPSSLTSALRALLPEGAEPTVRVDEALVAGAVLRAGETVFDGTVRAQVLGMLEAAA